MRKIAYGKAKSTIFVINREGVIPKTPTTIFEYKSLCGLEIRYNYNCPDNTFNHPTFELISKTEFDSIIKDIKARNKVNFTIKIR